MLKLNAKQHSQWPSIHTWKRIKVSKTMRSVLRNLLRKPQATNANKRTVDALRRRNFVDKMGQLTNEGYVYALGLCPLHEQVKFLNIPLSHVELPKNNERPEFDLLNKYKDDGYLGCFAEGGAVFILLYSMWFDTFLPFVQKEYDDVEYMMYNVYSYYEFLDIIPDVRNKLLHAIQHISRSQIASNFDKIESLQYSKSWFPYGYNGITKLLILQLFDSLTRDQLEGIVSVFLKDLRLFNKGWPDLTLIRDGKVKFVEVKTSDKLHFSQLIVLPTMMEEADLDFEVSKIKYI